MSSLKAAKEILSKVLYVPVNGIPDDASIADVKPLDSLSFEALILEIEERSGREVDPVLLVGMKTVEDLANILRTLEEA